MKNFSILILILAFLTFLFYQTQKSADFQVLKVLSSTQIIVDLNNNGVEDENETITLKNIQSFLTKPNKEQSELAKKLKISQEDAIGLGFLAQNFANETLEGKKVKFKENKLFVDNKNYENLIIEWGFAVFNGKAPNKAFFQNLNKVQKLHLVILNNKNHKYHKLTCKYGLLAHNSQILPVSQLTNDAKPCKFCFGDKQKAKGKRQKVIYDEIPYVKSPLVIFQTSSIKIFLTDMTRVLKPSNSCNTAVCRALVREINSAQNSIDFAIYGYTKIPLLENALLNAQKRGVKVRFVYDSDSEGKNIYPDTIYFTQIFKNNNSDYSPPLMHDKIFIFDGKTVMTGSANVSNTDMSGFNSNAIILINSPQIANIYEQEFEQMYDGKFHKQKAAIKNKESEQFAVYFSPEDKVITKQVIPLINNAHKYIYIPAFLITHKQMAQSLIDTSKRGVNVKIILDATNTHDNSSKLKMLRQNGIPVKTEIFAGKLHSKSIIIDDLYTVIGSMNFSRSGEGVNDENLIIIKNKDIAVFYRKFFEYLWARIPDKWLKYNARSESPDSIGSCSDGIDNDFDGKIDKADDSCKWQKANSK